MYKILNNISSPKDLKNKSIKELIRLSVEIRDFLLTSVSDTGGHLASNLGVVELTIGLHYVFNSPKDKLIWDVGHQSYIHKILTGRMDKFSTLREFNGLSGFVKRKESEHDIFQAGHSSTSISAAIGLAKARDLNKENYNIIPIIGDGAMTGGMAYEALNYLGHSKEKVIVVLNDNGMSIDKNVGALSKKLSSLRLSDFYNNAKDETKTVLNNIPKLGDSLKNTVSKAKHSLKCIMLPNMLFEELGFTYLGPIDGHDLSQVIKAYEKAKEINGPVLLHMVTKKGKGYLPAEKNPNSFHGVGPFSLKKGEKNSSLKEKYSEITGKTITKLADENDDIVGITAAMPSGTGMYHLKNKYPKRYMDVGIAEQNATTIAAGLAIAGKKPFFAVYSTFLQRAYDQILHDICIQNLPVVFCIDRAGLVGKDGETHHGVFDLSYLLSMPNMKIMAPKDGYELSRMLEFAANYKEGPLAIRYPRGVSDYINESRKLITKAEILRHGDDIAILAVGKMVSKALEVAEILEEKNISVKVINQRVIKPIKVKELKNSLGPIDKVITMEDNVIIGGFGSYIKQLIGNHYKVLNLGIKDKFVEHGSTDKLFEQQQLDVGSIVRRINRFMEGSYEIF